MSGNWNLKGDNKQLSPEEDMAIRMAREDFLSYCAFMDPTFKFPRHIKYLASKLESVERQELLRLGIFMPPRHGKTQTSSKLFVAWYLGRHPERTVIFATYGQALATSVGREVRNIMSSPKHLAVFPECILSEDSTAADEFSLTKKGGYLAVGRGGPITGRGADLLIIDDPLKDDMEANSDTIRDAMKQWYVKVAYSRLTPKGAVLVIQTRWHVDDLAGWLLREHAQENWVTIEMPAIAEKDEEWRKEGEALWPEQFPLERLFQIQAAQTGTNAWISLYQQKPTLEGGFMFKREDVKFYISKPYAKGMNVYIVVDPANSKKKGSDATAMWVIGLASDHNFYVLDIVRDYLNLSQRLEVLFRLHRTWHPLAVGYESYGLQTDIPIIQERQSKENYYFEVKPLGGIVHKIDRIRRLVEPFSQKRFYFPEDCFRVNTKGENLDLVKHFIDREFCVYPGAQHDDMLDALARLFDPDFPTVFPMTWEEEAEQYSTKQTRGSHWAALLAMGVFLHGMF